MEAQLSSPANKPTTRSYPQPFPCISQPRTPCVPKIQFSKFLSFRLSYHLSSPVLHAFSFSALCPVPLFLLVPAILVFVKTATRDVPSCSLCFHLFIILCYCRFGTHGFGVAYLLGTAVQPCCQAQVGVTSRTGCP
jgi:hypothetical protein